MENHLLYRRFSKSVSQRILTVSSCCSVPLLLSAVVRNRARTRFTSHSRAHVSFVTSLLCISFFHPTSEKKKCCLHPPSSSLSLSSKIILKSASTVQRRRRGAQKETHHCRCRRASKHAARLHDSNTTAAEEGAAARFGFQSCHSGFAGAFGNAA